MNAKSFVTISAKRRDGSPFEGDLFVFVALPKSFGDEEPRVELNDGSMPIPSFKAASMSGKGIYKIALLKNSLIRPRGSKYAIVASNGSNEAVNCLSFVAEDDELFLEAEVP